MHPKPKLIAFDLDGTLAESKTPMSAQMGALMAKLLSSMPAAVLSGASFKQFETQLLPAIPSGARLENLYLFPMNASVCYRYQAGAWQRLYDESFTEEETARVLHELNEAMKQTGFDKPPPKLWGERIENRGSQITFSALGQQAPAELKYAWDPDRKKREAIAALIQQRIPEYDVRIGGATSIDITKKGVNKAYGIRKIEQFLGIEPDHIVFVGDSLFYGGNDYPAKATGVDCIQVSGPEETKKLITEWVA